MALVYPVGGNDDLREIVQELLNRLATPHASVPPTQNGASLRHLQELGHEVVQVALERFTGNKRWGSRNGCYICVADYQTGFPHLVFSVGEPVPEKLFKYWLFAQEKPLRTAAKNQETSFESADDDDHFGGAVRHGNMNIGCSGFIAHGDEAVVLGMHILAGNMSIKSAERIARQSNNWIFDALVDDIREMM